MAEKKITDEIGSEIAGSLIAPPLIQLLVEKRLISVDEASRVLDRAASSVKDAANPEGRAAYQALMDLRKRLHP